MNVQIRLHAVLKELLPDGRGTVELSEEANVSDLLDQLNVDKELRELVTVNGAQVEDLSRRLEEGDIVEVFPAVAGGSKRSAYIDEGVRLFNEGNYFLSHETFEEHWIEAPEPERNFLQGLIHLAVGFHHYNRDNLRGARSQFAKAQRRLGPYANTHEGIDVAGVQEFLKSALEAIDEGRVLTPPRL